MYIYVGVFSKRPFGGGSKNFLRPSKKILRKKLSVYFDEKWTISSIYIFKKKNFFLYKVFLLFFPQKAFFKKTPTYTYIYKRLICHCNMKMNEYI